MQTDMSRAYLHGREVFGVAPGKKRENVSAQVLEKHEFKRGTANPCSLYSPKRGIEASRE